MNGLLLASLSLANAASLDLLEVGGVYGSPGATDATATWWNPAGLAADAGTRFHLEGAPLFARVMVQRDNPDYPYNPDAFGPETYDYGGEARYTRSTVVPFLGVTSDLGHPGLGVGLSIAVPHGRGAGGAPDQVTRHHLVKGGNQAVYAQVSAAYEVKERFAFGLTAAYVMSAYESDLYTESVTGLNDALKETFNRDEDYYSDTVLEDERYATRVSTDGALTDNAVTFGVGLRYRASDRLAFALAYRHGFRVDNEGTATLAFDCPTVDDFWGRAGAELAGLCNAELKARQVVGYDLPARVHGGVVFRPVETVRLEFMGGYVGWSVFTDYDITIEVDPESVPAMSDTIAEQTAASVSQVKQWARDNRDSFWFGLDGKVRAGERFELGGRFLFDRSAVPTQAVGPNNYDADTVIVATSVLGKVHRNLALGASVGQYFAAPRRVTDSVFALAVAPERRRETRYFYPSMNGTYLSSITRLGLIVRGSFGQDSR